MSAPRRRATPRYYATEPEHTAIYVVWHELEDACQRVLARQPMNVRKFFRDHSQGTDMLRNAARKAALEPER
jgi:hypothetical protein